MAQKSTIFKVELQVADMDRIHYQNYSITLARHPSETELRMLIRLLAFAFNASEDLLFSKGISTDNEPDIWQKNLTGDILLWIDLGQPDEKRIRKACGRAQHVIVYTYQQRSAEHWWQQTKNNLDRFDNLQAYRIIVDDRDLEVLVNRNMKLQCTIQDGVCWLTDGNTSARVTLEKWK
jgi:uncharacterized protein YaeQ